MWTLTLIESGQKASEMLKTKISLDFKEKYNIYIYIYIYIYKK